MKHIVNKNFIFFLLTLCLPILLLAITPPEMNQVYKANWICASISLWISLIILSLILNTGRADAYSPIVLYSAVYIIMFFVTPLYDIINGKTLVFGVDLLEYGVKGILVALLGYVMLALMYCYKSMFSRNKRKTICLLSDSLKQSAVQLAIVFWIIDFVLAIALYAIQRGFSFSYILSFGIIGNANAFETTSSPLGFIQQFTRSIVSVYLIIFSLSENKILKISLFILTALVEVSNGFRYMLIILIASLVIYNKIAENKEINYLKGIVIICIVAVAVSIIGYARTNVRAGKGFSIDGFSFNDVLNTIFGNFGIYKSYYAVIKAVPTMLPYMYLYVIVFYTLILGIPRAIWPGKPGNPINNPQLYAINELAYYGGYAYPNLGEYYYSSGIIGVMLFMSISGVWLAHIENRLRFNATTQIEYVLYAVLVPSSFQLITRGYTPGNFYLLVALMLPCWVFKSYIKKRSIRN